MNRLVLLLTLMAWAAPAWGAEDHLLELQKPVLLQPDEGGGEGRGGGSGSFLAGRTLGSGSDGILAQFGWPGISLEYLHGVSDVFDLGGKFTFNYGEEGIPYIDPGLKFAAVLRLGLLDKGKINLGLNFEPGLTMYFRYDRFREFAFGMAVPVGLALGIEVGDALMLHFGLDLPMLIYFVPDVEFDLPILMGVGLEYRLDSNLSLTFDTRFGPDIEIGNFRGSPYAEFAFRVLMGIAYRF